MRNLGRTLVIGVYCGGLLFWITGGAHGGPPDGADALPPELARKLAEVDRDGDGRVQPAEWPLDAASFEEADRDGDGALTVPEIIRAQAIQEARKKRTKGDELTRKFRQADEDGDGAIQRAEFPAADPLFERFDRDGDGQVTMSEAEAFAIEEEVAKLFTEHDADLSGTLTRDEVPDDGVQYFAAADADGDGALTGEEAYAFLADIRAASAADAGAPSRRGADAPSEARSQPAAAGASQLGVLGVLLTSRAQRDADGDGRLDRDEFPASLELFERLDVDRDGAVSGDELELRKRYAARLGARGDELKARAQELGREAELGAIGLEGLALFQAGRYEEVDALLDQIELRLLR